MRSRSLVLWLAVFVACAAPADAGSSLELVHGRGRNLFLGAGVFPGALRFQAGLRGDNPQPGAPVIQNVEDGKDAKKAEKDPLRGYLDQHVRAAGQDAPQTKAAVAAPTPTQEVDLAKLLNRQLKSKIEYALGGKKVWISGAFDRGTWDPAEKMYKNQNAYVSVLIDGQEAQFFDVLGVFKKPQVLDIGTGKYKLSVAPDMDDNLNSEIVLTNVANRRERESVTLRDMLAAVAEKGDEVRAGGQAYRLFYYSDIKDGKVDAANRLFVFLLTDAKGELHVFIIPAELVPGDKIAIFNMHDNKSVGLQQADGKLKVFDNP